MSPLYCDCEDPPNGHDPFLKIRDFREYFFSMCVFLWLMSLSARKSYASCPATPSPLNKALMRLWTQFNERDRCSLGARWTGNLVTAGLRPGNLPLIWAQPFPPQVAGLGRRHEADQMEEQPSPWSDALPGPLLQLSQSQGRHKVSTHSSWLHITSYARRWWS